MPIKEAPKEKEESENMNVSSIQNLRQLFVGEALTQQRMDMMEDVIQSMMESLVDVVQKNKEHAEKLAILYGQGNQSPSVMAPVNPQDQGQRPAGAIEELTEQITGLNQMQGQSKGY